MELAFEESARTWQRNLKKCFNPFYNGTGFRRDILANIREVISLVSILFIMELAFEDYQGIVQNTGKKRFNPFYNGTGFRSSNVGNTWKITAGFNPFYNGTGFRSRNALYRRG